MNSFMCAVVARDNQVQGPAADFNFAYYKEAGHIFPSWTIAAMIGRDTETWRERIAGAIIDACDT